MTLKKVNKKGKEKQSIQDKSIVLDLTKFYDIKQEDISLDINLVKYSNAAYIQVSHRDVYIDFMEMPGMNKEGKMIINGTRIFMSHVAAEKLGETLLKILNQVHEKGDMEIYNQKAKK